MLQSVAKVFASGEKRPCRIVCLVGLIFVLLTLMYVVEITVNLAQDLTKNERFMNKVAEVVACRLADDGYTAADVRALVNTTTNSSDSSDTQ